jgi:hypothetical protein
MNLTKEQEDKILHASGLTQAKESYRNHYNCEADEPDWLAIVAHGLATGPHSSPSYAGSAFFYLNDLGIDVAYGIARRRKQAEKAAKLQARGFGKSPLRDEA